MSEESRKIYGNEIAGKVELFESKLKSVEEKYAYWFANRVNVITDEKPDSLDNYYRYNYSKDGITFSIKEELPVVIKDDCISAFNEVFKTQA